jgi:replicative DNA helicase
LIEGKGKEADVEAAFKVLTENEKLYQFQTKMDDTVDDLVEQIRFLVTAMGVEYVFLEPIQDLISGNTSEKESLLTDLTNKLKRLAPEINVGIVVIAHANDDGEAKYCRSIVQGAAFEIALERDVDAEDPHERNLTRVRVGRKNRVGGGSGPAGALTFDVDTYTMTPELGPQEPHVKLVGNGDPF